MSPRTTISELKKWSPGAPSSSVRQWRWKTGCLGISSYGNDDDDLERMISNGGKSSSITLEPRDDVLRFRVDVAELALSRFSSRGTRSSDDTARSTGRLLRFLPGPPFLVLITGASEAGDEDDGVQSEAGGSEGAFDLGEGEAFRVTTRTRDVSEDVDAWDLARLGPSKNSESVLGPSVDMRRSLWKKPGCASSPSKHPFSVAVSLVGINTMPAADAATSAAVGENGEEDSNNVVSSP